MAFMNSCWIKQRTHLSGEMGKCGKPPQINWRVLADDKESEKCYNSIVKNWVLERELSFSITLLRR